MSDSILLCGHCGNRTPHEILKNVTTYEEFFDSEGLSMGSCENYYWLVQCGTCSKISLLGNWEINDDGTSISSAIPLYPEKKSFPDIVPKKIISNYHEALKVKKLSKISFAILIRKILETMLKDKKAEGQYLKDKINYLAKNGIIPSVFAETAKLVKYLGDRAAHAEDFIRDDEVDILNDFTVALIEYVYIAPDKLNTLRKSIEEKKKPS